MRDVRIIQVYVRSLLFHHGLLLLLLNVVGHVFVLWGVRVRVSRVRVRVRVRV